VSTRVARNAIRCGTPIHTTRLRTEPQVFGGLKSAGAGDDHQGMSGRQPDYDFFHSSHPGDQYPGDQYPGGVPRPGQPPAWGAPAGWAAPAPPARSRRPLMRLALLALAVLVPVGALAAWAVSGWLARAMSAHGIWQRTTISAPASFDGVPRATAQQLPTDLRQGTQSAFPGATAKDVAFYVRADSRMVVFAGRSPTPMTARGQAAARSGFLSTYHSSALSLKPVDAGSLGGWFGCGTDTNHVTVCVATDPGALVVVMVGPGQGEPIERARRLREATEHRR
jgi:hypothetical protein